MASRVQDVLIEADLEAALVEPTHRFRFRCRRT
jgi:hypothetical protein